MLLRSFAVIGFATFALAACHGSGPYQPPTDPMMPYHAGPVLAPSAAPSMLEACGVDAVFAKACSTPPTR